MLQAVAVTRWPSGKVTRTVRGSACARPASLSACAAHSASKRLERSASQCGAVGEAACGGEDGGSGGHADKGDSRVPRLTGDA